MQLDGLQLSWRRDLQMLERRQASDALRTAAARPGGMPPVRAMLREVLGAMVDQLDNAAVLERACGEIERGALRIFRQRRMPGTWSDRVALPDEPPAEPVLAAGPEVTWIEIQLLDEEGEPVPGHRYEIELPDGSVKKGTLNYRGRARVDGIDAPGACQIRFPELDADAWEPY